MPRWYDRREWRDRIQPRQLAREPMCQWPQCERPADTVDHITPISQGGAKRDPGNLQSLCFDHHQIKRAAERHGQDWRKQAYRGCNDDGTPRDPEHPWNQGQGGIDRHGLGADDRRGRQEKG